MEKEKKLNTLSYVFLTIAVISGILVCLLLSNLIPVQAKDVGFSPTYPYMFESYWDSDLVFGSSNLIYKNDKYYNPTDNPDGVLQLSYPMSAGSDQWTGTFKSYGWSDSDIAFVRGSILNDNAWATVKVSTDNWISSVALRHMNPDDDVHAILYFRGFSSADQSTAEYAFVSYNWGIRVGFDKVLVGDGEYQLFKWNAGTSTWDTVSLYATQALMDDLTILAVNDVTGMEWINLAPNGSVNINRAKFTLDPADDPDEPDNPDTGAPVVVSYLFYQESGYYLVDLSYTPSSFEADLTTTVSSILASSGNLNRVFTGSGYLLNASPGTYSGSSASNKPLYNVMQYVFTASSIDYVRIYSIGSVLPTSDMEWLKANYSYSNVSTSMTTIYDAFRLGLQSIPMSSGTVYSVNAYSRYSYSTGYRTYPFNIVASSASVKVLSLGNNPGYDVYNNAGSSYVVYWGQWFMLGNDAPSEGPVASPTPTPEPTLPPGVSPTPTPDPNATPTPTPPTVIIQWPTNTPTPTPFPLDFTMPTLPGGDLKPHTTENVLSQGLEQIRLHLNTGLLATAFSYVPPELQFLIWFLVFVLLLLAVVKLIIHFGG